MSDKPNNPQAFPRLIREYSKYSESAKYRQEEGMELRDYFAAKAMQAIIPMSQGARYQETIDKHIASIPKRAYDMADAMLKEREK